MNVGDPTRKIPGFEEVYSRGTERRGKQKTEFRIRGIPPLKHMQEKFRKISDHEVQ
jgi:hypothetical protein